MKFINQLSKTGYVALNLALVLIFSSGCGKKALADDALRPNLIHRYNFKDGTANDSVGKINGALVGDAKIIDGKLVLNNTSKVSSDAALSYLKFDDRILPKTGSATIEVWFTSTSDGVGSVVFGFGQAGPVTYRNVVMESSPGRTEFTTKKFQDISSFSFIVNVFDNSAQRRLVARAGLNISVGDQDNEVSVKSARTMNDGKPHLVAIVIDSKEGMLHLFIDGREEGTGVSLGHNTLDAIQMTNNWLGRSLYDNHAGFSGSINEVRVFDSALASDQIGAQFKAGHQ
jgi:hypothetical protein